MKPTSLDLQHPERVLVQPLRTLPIPVLGEWWPLHLTRTLVVAASGEECSL